MFRRKIEVRPHKMKNYIGTNEIFHTKAEKRIGFFSSTARFRSVPYFMKTGNTAKWGKKKSIFQKSRENTPCDISNSLFIITDRK